MMMEILGWFWTRRQTPTAEKLRVSFKNPALGGTLLLCSPPLRGLRQFVAVGRMLLVIAAHVTALS